MKDESRTFLDSSFILHPSSFTRMSEGERNGRSAARRALLYHFCRLQLPGVTLAPAAFDRHLERAYELYRTKRTRESLPASWDHFLENLHAVDWYLSGGCPEG